MDGLGKVKADEASSKIYDKLLRCLDQFAEYTVENKKTSLHITHGRAFLGVHPRKSALLVNIVLDRPLETNRLKKSEKVSANRYHNEVVISSAEELDSELVGWLKEAYALTANN